MLVLGKHYDVFTSAEGLGLSGYKVEFKITIMELVVMYKLAFNR